MTHQRRRSQLKLRVWPTVTKTDRRGNRVAQPDTTSDPVEIRCWEIPERSARAEVPGQQQINVIRVGIDLDNDTSLWGRIEHDGREWDIAEPPSRRNGIRRHTAHQSVLLRERPVVGA